MKRMNQNLEDKTQIKRKHFPIFIIISVVLLMITLCLSVASWRFNSWENSKHKLTLLKSFHIGLGRTFNDPILGSITFFNDEYPYRGSIIKLNTGEKPTYRRVWYFWIYGYSHEEYKDKLGSVSEFMYCCDLPGIYSRFFKMPSFTIWTLTIGLWLPLLVFSLLPLIKIWKCRRRKVIG
jgi:hypothetical protein